MEDFEPDVLFVPMALAKPVRAYRYALTATFASTLGGITGCPTASPRRQLTSAKSRTLLLSPRSTSGRLSRYIFKATIQRNAGANF